MLLVARGDSVGGGGGGSGGGGVAKGCCLLKYIYALFINVFMYCVCSSILFYFGRYVYNMLKVVLFYISGFIFIIFHMQVFCFLLCLLFVTVYFRDGLAIM